MTLVEKFNIFVKSIPIVRLTKKIKEATGQDQEGVEEMLAIYINEARGTFNLVEPYLHQNVRMLEVGAGLCVLCFFLKKEGFDIIALEPAAAGFDFFSVFQKVMVDHFREIDLPILRYPAEELQVKRVGRFDLIFSFNVIEHISEPFSTLLILVSMLNRQGRMVHSCPNYLVPYEPHFGVPVLKVWPGLSRFIFRKRIVGREALWESLNFITYFEVSRFAKQNKLSVSFSKGLLYDALVRIDNDPLFRKRQDSIFVITFLFLIRFLGGPTLLKKLPPSCATPMTFLISSRLKNL